MAASRQDRRVALVTGGTGPVGRAIVAALAGAGASVAVVHDDPRRPTGLPEGVRTYRADVTDRAATEAAIEQVAQEMGPVDVLVANASRRVAGSFLELDVEDLRDCVEVDVYGALACMRAVARGLRARAAPGRLIVVTSAAGLRAVPGSCGHAVAKAMATTLAQVAAVELGGDRICCNVVATGWVDTALPAGADRAIAMAATPAGRLVDPGEVGAVCAFLASDAASGVNGAVITVDGGYSVTKSPGGSPLVHAP